MSFISELRSDNSLRSNAYAKLAESTSKQSSRVEALTHEKEESKSFVGELRSDNSLRTVAYAKLAESRMHQSTRAAAVKTEKSVSWSDNLVDVRTIPVLERAERISSILTTRGVQPDSDPAYVQWKLNSIYQRFPELSFKAQIPKSEAQPDLVTQELMQGA